MNVLRTLKFLSDKPHNVNNATKSHTDRLACFSFHSGFSMNCFIGTAVALAGLREGLRWAEVDVPICRQNDSFRFDSGLRINLKILKGPWSTILVDFRKS